MSDVKPLRLSWSRLRLHGECAAKGSLIAAGHKSPVTDVRNFFPGTVTDRCMRQWLSLDQQEMGWMGRHVDEIMSAEEVTAKETGDGVVKWRSAADKAEVRDMCHTAVGVLESSLDALLGLSWKPPEQRCDWDPAPRFEVPCTIPYGSTKVRIFLVGEIDLVVIRPDGFTAPAGLEIWDLKTTRDNSYWRKTLGQLMFYEIAMWCKRKQWATRSGLLQPLCDDPEPNWSFTMDHRTQMLQRIVSVAGDILAGRVDPKPSQSLCGRCEVRHACPLKGGGRGRAPMALPVSGA